MAREGAIAIARVLMHEPTAALASTATAPANATPGQMAGQWTGRLEHFDGPVPLHLKVTPEGKVELTFANRPPLLLQDAAFGGTTLTGWLDALLRTREDYHGVTPLRFRLWRQGDKLTGFAMANVTGYFGLPFYVELTR